MLDIGPTADTTAIRRAYHAQLRKIDPDNDPASFIALRQAFEDALTWTPPDDDAVVDEDDGAYRFEDRTEPGDPTADDDLEDFDDDYDDRPKRTEPENAWESDARAEDRKLIAAFDQATQNRRAADAEPLFNAIMAKGIVDLGDEAAFIGQFLEAALEDLAFPGPRLEELTKHLLTARFIQADDRLTPLREQIHRRLEAEHWHAALRDQANERWLLSRKKRRQRRVARLFLKQRWQGVFLWVNGTVLDRALVQYRAHMPWLAVLLDPDWMARIERKRKRQNQRGMILIWIIAALVALDFVYVVGRGLITGDWN